jgi:hypothetical protein
MNLDFTNMKKKFLFLTIASPCHAALRFGCSTFKRSAA